MSDKSYSASIRAAFRGLWSQQLTTLDFADAMYSAIRRGFESAFREGSAECGVKPDERTEEEQKRLDGLIGDNFQYVGSLADWLFNHSKLQGVKFDEVLYRAAIWDNRYEEVKAIAQMLACGNRKYQWLIDGGEHCRSCLKLNGRVARAKAWSDRGITPRVTSGILKCGGFNCKCQLIETDLPVTKGRWPNLP